MKNEAWHSTVLSEPDYEHLVAELYFGEQFLLLLDREEGKGSICIAFPDKSGKLGKRIPIDEFIHQLKITADDLSA